MFSFLTAPGESTPFILTNKHVVKNAKEVKLSISTSSPGDHTTRTGVAEINLTEGWQDLWLPHPNPGIDLGGIAFGPLIDLMTRSGHQGYGVMFSESDILSQSELENLSSVEDILLIGYPNNFYDRLHNQPITRQGITASDPKLPFNGKDEFMIDCSVFPGSSGSPIVLKEKYFTQNHNNQLTMERRRTALLGVLWGGPQHTVHGEVIPQPIPTVTQTQSKHLMNLGYAISACKIIDLKAQIPKLPKYIQSKIHMNFIPAK